MTDFYATIEYMTIVPKKEYKKIKKGVSISPLNRLSSYNYDDNEYTARLMFNNYKARVKQYKNFYIVIEYELVKYRFTPTGMKVDSIKKSEFEITLLDTSAREWNVIKVKTFEEAVKLVGKNKKIIFDWGELNEI